MDSRIDIVNINGTELKYSWFDMALRKRYIEAAEKYAKAISVLNDNLDDELDNDEEINYYIDVCELTFKLFDETFGEGTADRIFGGVHDYIVCSAAVRALTESRFKQQEYVTQLGEEAKALANA